MESISKKKIYPFSAIVGQEKLKTAYLLNLINPKIGGLLISGPKGTGKSTLVHSIIDILPYITINKDCPFGCLHENKSNYCDLCKARSNIDPLQKKVQIISLPLSCTEDRLIGSIDIESLLKDGTKKIIPGILGNANNNILYIDEVNLLPDHIVDDILDVSASKINTIEREGISISHNSDFILIGSMNPEEGELRPQLLDRFPLCVEAENINDPNLRSEIITRNLLYMYNYFSLRETFSKDDESLKAMISSAKEKLTNVKISTELLYCIAGVCSELKVDGQRPDITITITAITLSALDGRDIVQFKDIILATEMTLNHRTRNGGLLEPPSVQDINDTFSKVIPSKKLDFTGNNLISLQNLSVKKSLGNFLVSDKKKI